MPIFKWLLSNCIWAAGWAVVAITIPHNYYSGHTTGSNWIIWVVGGQTAASRHRSDAGLLYKQSSVVRITDQDETGKTVEPCCLWELQLRPGCCGAFCCPPDSQQWNVNSFTIDVFFIFGFSYCVHFLTSALDWFHKEISWKLGTFV